MSLKELIDGEDYINASWIMGKNVIATQGPLSNTIVHFLQLLIEQKVDAIVMLCKTLEEDKNGRITNNIFRVPKIYQTKCILILIWSKDSM